MSEQEEPELKEGDGLQQALKKLNVGVDWGSALFVTKEKQICTSSPGNMSEEKESKKKATTKPSRKLSNRVCRQRNQPYQKDNLPFSDNNIPSMDKLTFATEICKNKNCTCNQPKGKSPEKTKEEKYPLNFAQASQFQTENGTMIKEPKLKLHHKEKDRRVVIRAARLKLAKQLKKSQPVFPNSAPKIGELKKSTVFGTESEKSLNFASLSSAASTTQASATPTFTGKSFGSYRHDASLSTSMQTPTAGAAGSSESAHERLDLSSLESSLPAPSINNSASIKNRGEKRRSQVSPSCPLHPGRCSRPCSCSQQAMRDPVCDYTVDELACYFDEFVHIPKKMSFMAEMMYT